MDETTRKLVKSLKEMTQLIRKRKPSMQFDDTVKQLSLAQAEVLIYLCEHKKAKMSDIAKDANVKLPTMTEIVDKLVKKGILKRERDEIDRRNVWISVSDNIKNKTKKIMQSHDRYIEKILSALTMEEKKQAINIINKIVNNLNKEGEV